MPTIQWSTRARRCLHVAFEQQGLLPQESELLPLYARLLGHLFPSHSVVVYWRSGGFDPYKMQHALLIEAFGLSPDATAESRVAVVKIGLEQSIRKEANGWKSVCPPGFGSDSVLLGLHEVGTAEADSQGRVWAAILYEDANQKIGAAEVVTLEAALTTACLSNAPSCHSVNDCIIDVYQRLEQHFYSGAIEENKTNTPIEQRIVGLCYPPHSQPTDLLSDFTASPLADRLARWRSEDRLRRLRMQANQSLREFAGRSSRLDATAPRDPVQAIDEVTTMFAIALGTSAESAALSGWLGTWLPAMMRGKTHGDLHARNVMVGLFDENANFPVVFDYEHTNTGKLIAWDFIKLEFETKTRVLDLILRPLEPREFGQEVIGFEQRLWDATERFSFSPQVPTEPATPIDRLLHLLLTLRRRAAFSLAAEQARTGHWLEEYKFLCAMYATMGAKYDYSDRQRIVALLSGGIAVGRSRWNEQLLSSEADRWQSALQNNTWLTATMIGWEQPYTVAKQLGSTGDPERLDQAKAILDRVVASFPHVPQPWEDLILVCLNQRQTAEADARLQQALRVVERTEELMCRFGRIEKDLGLAFFSKKNWSAAVHHFVRAFDYYHQAHRFHEGHYPAINMASVRLHQAVAEHHLNHPEHCEALLQESRAIAQKLLTTRSTWLVTHPQDSLWHLATEAEANFLTGNATHAADLYEQASKHPLLTPEAWKSIESQRTRNEQLVDQQRAGF
jgi:tetratricopeptide (TPR) repeat protein